MFQRITIVFILVAAIALPGIALQRDQTRTPRQRPGQGERLGQSLDRSIERLQRALNLTPDQVASLRPVMEAHQQNLRPLGEDVRAKAQALRELEQQPNPDPAALGNALLALRAARERVREAQTGFDTSLKNLLTQEQQSVLEGMRIGARGRGFGGPGGPGMRGPGPRGFQPQR